MLNHWTDREYLKSFLCIYFRTAASLIHVEPNQGDLLSVDLSLLPHVEVVAMSAMLCGRMGAEPCRYDGLVLDPTISMRLSICHIRKLLLIQSWRGKKSPVLTAGPRVPFQSGYEGL